MARKSDCSSVYRYVIDNVVAKLKDEFAAANVDESVLFELRSKWEEKLLSQGLITDNLGNDEHLGVPSGVDAFSSRDGEFNGEEARDHEDGVNDGKRKIEDHNAASEQEYKRQVLEADNAQKYYASSYIPQHDGPGDFDGAERQDPESQEAGAVGSQEANHNNNNDGEELSDDDSDDAEEEEVENLLIGQFEKVNKVKLRWKVTMKDCVFHMGGKDFLVKKCTGDFPWL